MYLKFYTAIHLCSDVALAKIWRVSYQVYVIVFSQSLHVSVVTKV